jgi:hypothetical protein
MKVPNSLYEFLRTEAFEEKKMVSFVIQEALEEKGGLRIWSLSKH